MSLLINKPMLVSIGGVGIFFVTPVTVLFLDCHAVATQQCQRKHHVFGLVRSDIVTTMSHECLEQFDETNKLFSIKPVLGKNKRVHN